MCRRACRINSSLTNAARSAALTSESVEAVTAATNDCAGLRAAAARTCSRRLARDQLETAGGQGHQGAILGAHLAAREADGAPAPLAMGGGNQVAAGGGDEVQR